MSKRREIARRVVGCILVALLAYTAVGIARPAVARAGVKDWVVEKIIKEIAKRILGNPDMTDEQVKEAVDEQIEMGFERWDIYSSEAERRARIESHCWRVYWTVLHPGQAAGQFYFGGLLPGEYLEGSVHDQLSVCVAGWYVPWPESEGAIDSE